ncbi:soma ferritin [Cimex lectularius]|uniref:Ferritin n=1 Tax=Cimex lectularius TaxID=79782 RepID=A0A8I6R9A3_CIMLE|nr:soma ferritin [Cimex lectularius]
MTGSFQWHRSAVRRRTIRIDPSELFFPPNLIKKHQQIINCQHPVRSTINKSAKMAASQVRQNFHADSEEAINKQINMELYASYTYLSMAYHFDRDDIALEGFSHYFKKASCDEREHAMKLMSYLNKRGGRILLQDVVKPTKDDWGTAEEAVAAALQLEKDVNMSLLTLHGIAGSHNDANLCDFIENEYLQEQVDSIKELGDLLTNVRRVGEGLGILVLDKELKSS